MDKTRIDPGEIAQLFAAARIKYAHKKLSNEQLQNILHDECKMSNVYIVEAKKRGFVHSRQNGLTKEYCFTDYTIGKEQFIKLYADMRKVFNKQRKPKEVTGSDIDKAIALLKKEGYIILRNDGIDESKLKAEMPEVYKKYQILKVM